MANGTTLGRAYVQIMPTAQGIGAGTTKILNGELGGVGGEAGASIGRNLVGAIKKIIVAAGIGKLLTSTIMEGAALQQSYIGGLETIYGKAADAARTYAQEAAQAGISMNTYAEQAVSFGAALRQAYGGDTLQAAEAANTALLDMADNAAKMGTPLESIQNAYQGFSKGNYMMLDNLRLGYSQGKEEMERLLADAEKLSGVHYDINNLGDVYQAIHVIQGELGLTGVAAEEAATTFSGSLNALKANFANLRGSMALGEAIGPALQGTLTSLMTFGKNAAKLLGNVFMSIPDLIRTGLSTLTGMFAEFDFSGFIEGFKTTATDLISAIMDSGPDFLATAVDMATGLIPGLVDVAANVLANVAGSLAEQIPVFLADLLPRILSFTERLNESAGNFVEAGINMLKSLLDGLIAALPTMLAYIPQIITNIANIVNENLPKLLMAGVEMIITLAKGLWDHRQDILNNLWNILQALISAITAINWISLGKDIITFIGNGIRNLASHLPDTLKGIAEDALQFVKNVDWLQLGKDIINGIVKGLLALGHLILDTLLGFAGNALSGVKKFLGINSPSKVFAEQVGQWIPAGIAEGIEDNADLITGALDDATALPPGITGAVQTAARTATAEPMTATGAPAGDTFNFAIYPAPGMDEQALADKIIRQLTTRETRRRQAWSTV